jgi:protein-arginine kinase activator protein McsA
MNLEQFYYSNKPKNMKEILYLNKENIKGMKLIGYREAEGQQKGACAFCGKAIKSIYIISNGEEFAEVGSECVKTIARLQNKEVMEGIDKIPVKKRTAIKPKNVIIADDELPF